MVIVGNGRYEIPDNFAYTLQHVYINPENGKIGLSQMGIDFIGQIKQIVFLKKDKIEKGKPFVSFELENGMLTLKSPVSGEIKNINSDVLKYWPNDMYNSGVLLEVTPTNLEADLEDLIKDEKIEEWAKREAVLVARNVFNYKIIEIGDSTVGKTAIKVRFTDNYFKKDLKSTLGVDFGVKEVQFHYVREDPTLGLDRITAKMNVWDTGGQEIYGSLRKMYYKEAAGCLVVYDVTNPESFENIPRWINELYDNVGTIPALLVGNKIDLERKVRRAKAEKFAKEKGYLYVETSAKTGENVSLAFKELAIMIYESREKKYNVLV
ncbi:MAG: GTP-binding protein [Candidatus Helarchaeota archaeon]